MSEPENTVAKVRKVGEPEKPREPLPPTPRVPIVLETVPDGRQAIVDRYGDPLEAGFIQTRLKVFHLPFEMRVSWQPGTVIQDVLVHRLVGPALVDALAEYLAKLGLEWIREMGWDEYGGCYNLRKNVNSPDKLSTHAWGIAIDLNPTANPNGQRECSQPSTLVNAFKSRGFAFVNGADWMHVQAATGY